MRGVEHVTVGAVVTAVVLFIIYKTNWLPIDLSGVDWIFLILVVYIYSQLPDIDSDVSIINKIWNTTAGLVAIYAIYTKKYTALGLFAASSIVILEWVKHRGVTHTEWFGLLMAAPLWFFNPVFAIVAAVCDLSHIIADGDFMR